MNVLKVGRFIDLSFLSPADNVLCDDLLLSLAEEGRLHSVLRLWESPVYFIVLGRTGKVHDDLHLQSVHQDRIPTLRRSSGGGTVIQGPGCLNYSLVLPKELDPGLHDLRKSYHIILSGVLRALSNCRVQAEFRPISDLALTANERKCSGNAQRRGRRCILHHGTLLYDFNLGLISQYLAMPKDIPEYRRERPHEQFVSNLVTVQGHPLSSEELKSNLLNAFGWTDQPIERALASVENERLKMMEKRINIEF